MIKIIAGSAKGAVLTLPPKSVYVRPILARIKKSLFDILRPKIAGCRFLDLYAGSGAVGLEALSRGASFVAFVEENPLCVSAINKNLERLHFKDKASVYVLDASTNLSPIHSTFDLIFLGPPYRDVYRNPIRLSSLTIQTILKAKILKEGGWIIAQHHKKELIDISPQEIVLFRKEFYGDSVLSFFQHAHS